MLLNRLSITLNVMGLYSAPRAVWATGAVITRPLLVARQKCRRGCRRSGMGPAHKPGAPGWVPCHRPSATLAHAMGPRRAMTVRDLVETPSLQLRTIAGA